MPSAGATLRVECRKDGADFKLIGDMDLSGGSPQLPLTGPIDLTGSGVVEKVMTLEGSFEKAIDLQYRLTATLSSDLSILGHTTQVHLDNIDWQVN